MQFYAVGNREPIAPVGLEEDVFGPGIEPKCLGLIDTSFALCSALGVVWDDATNHFEVVTSLSRFRHSCCRFASIS
jgi:hypothetical protein